MLYIADEFRASLLPHWNDGKSDDLTVFSIDLVRAKKMVEDRLGYSLVQDETRARILSRLLGIDLGVSTMGFKLFKGDTVLVGLLPHPLHDDPPEILAKNTKWFEFIVR